MELVVNEGSPEDKFRFPISLEREEEDSVRILICGVEKDVTHDESAVRAGTTLQIGESKVLFQSPLTSPSMEVNEYWATHDGQKFLFVAPQTPAGANEPINVVVSWDANLPK